MSAWYLKKNDELQIFKLKAHTKFSFNVQRSPLRLSMMLPQGRAKGLLPFDPPDDFKTFPLDDLGA